MSNDRLRLYDIQIDDYREVTQADVDRLTRSEQVLGQAIRYLRSTGNLIDRDVASYLAMVGKEEIAFSHLGNLIDRCADNRRNSAH